VRVSVVVPAWNARDELRLLLLSLGRCAVGPEDSLEVVVADDGSADGTGDMLATLSVPYELRCLRLPRTDRSGRGSARNAALAEAAGDLVVMVDADQVVGPDFLGEHLCYHRLRDDVVVVGPRPDLGDGPLDGDRLARGSADAIPPVAWDDPRLRLLAEFSGNFNGFETCWHLMYSCNVSVRTGHLRAVGGFDEAFRGWGLEDSELGYRLRQRGLAFAFNPAAVAYHQRTRQVDARMYVEWKRNLAYMIDKHDTPEVAVQSVLDLAFGPDRRLSWLEAARRLEYASRGLAGRLPGPDRYEVLTVDADGTGGAAAELAVRDGTRDLVIIDDTLGADLAGPVQCADSAREVRYFHRPTPAVLDRLAAHLIG
jgi:GT2 family glycosyltransferase